MNKATVTMLAAALLLAGCGDSDVREVRDWMAQVQRDTKPSVKPLAAPKDFLPYAYDQKEAVDPFNQNKLLGELAKVAESSNNPNRPDMNRPKELLETFPLDTMKMVGAIQKGGVTYGLVQIDKNVYQVKSGMRLGENYGLVTRVSDNAIDVREVVQDAGGDWVDRMARLELQEK
ncbi:MAG: pilus assembly protein PilP [Telluria sp.]